MWIFAVMATIYENKAYNMQIGWREFIKGWFKKSSIYHSIGIEIGVGDIHISTLQQAKGNLTLVKQHSLPADGWQNELKTYVEQNNMVNTPCHIALSISKYQLIQVDKPAVEEAELLQALQWTIKEQLVNDEQWVIDYFDPPASPSNVKKVNVVAVAQGEIIDIRDGILKAGLNLNTIGVEELANCNLFPATNEAIISLKQETGGQLSLNIVKNNTLYFSRRLRGYENLASFTPEELQMGVADNLSLEIQRLMDYFESQLRQAPVKSVYISLDTLHQDELANLIKQVIFISVEKFTPQIPTENHMPLNPAIFTSLGAAINKAGALAG
jgi:MSHA biogenesis protein MshI